MKVISVVSVLLLTAFAVYGNPLGPVKDSSDLDDTELVRQNREAPENYEPVECYSFGKPLKKLKIFGKKPFKKTKASGNPLVQCITAAKDNDYAAIGIQKIKNKIICRGGNVNEVQLKPGGVLEKYKLDQKKCEKRCRIKKNNINLPQKIKPREQPTV
ncbi:hypothetical protein OS493_016023 [Desmophyllum pertusum]|uniref:Uncharacterized protein n=1 Tax=Desmophyllum pertusum TaxID=174260 RepID=A0A9X0D8Y3_9CNID|nr:hypothetical protein OS493_016023 [Desmophyllum pertusum]